MSSSSDDSDVLSLVAVSMADSELEGFRTATARPGRGAASGPNSTTNSNSSMPTLGLKRVPSPSGDRSPSEQSPRESPRKANPFGTFVRGGVEKSKKLFAKKSGRGGGKTGAGGITDSSDIDTSSLDEIAVTLPPVAAVITPDMQLALDALPMQPGETLSASFPGFFWAYDTHNPDAMRSGLAFLTNADFGFLPEQDVEGFRVPLHMVSAVNKIGRRKGRGELYFVDVSLHDFRVLRLAVTKGSDQRSQLFDMLMDAAFVDSIEDFFAFHAESNRGSVGWSLYRAEQEFRRQFQRVGPRVANRWRIFVNSDYSICSTYPKVLAVPADMDDPMIARVAQFRSRGRFPALSYLHTNGRSITRAAQPLVGLQSHRSMADEALIDAIRVASDPQDCLFIVDARPKANAVANQAMGKGMESEKHYPNTRIQFGKIANIHVMRESILKLAEDVAQGRRDVVSSSWLDHVRRIVTNGVIIAAKIHVQQVPVLLHCSDGWDRTAQLTSLAMLMLDPFYRTIRGFASLIEKEWISFGHQFAKRTGHEPKKMSNASDQERAPVFLQFLDCVYQLLHLCPCSFEFNEMLLSDIMDAVYSCHFGTFLCDCEQERDEAQLRSRTESFWTVVELRQETSQFYSNVFYSTEQDVILPKIAFNSITLWPYLLRHYEPKAKDSSRPILQPPSIEDAYRKLLDENERLKKLLESQK